MKVGVVGATGKAGQLIVREALDRDIEVHALVRSPEKLDVDIPTIAKDAFDLTTSDLSSYDVIVNAIGLPPEHAEKVSEIGSHLIGQLEPINNTRFVTMGHAGTLFQSEDRDNRVFESDTFPEEFKATVANHLKNLENLESTNGFQWTFVCPASFFDPQGPYTKDYQISGDVRIKNKEGKSYVSYADFASALVDEVVENNHPKQQIGVVGEKE